MKKYSDINVLTSFIFLVPAAFSLYNGIYWHFMIILLSTTFSVLFHLNKRKSFIETDMFFAAALMLSNLYLLYLSGFILTYTIFVTFFVITGFYFLHKARTREYTLNHPLWHLSSVMITLLCILAYSKIY